jgi:hypothetical protein
VCEELTLCHHPVWVLSLQHPSASCPHPGGTQLCGVAVGGRHLHFQMVFLG